jgi:glucose/arabinose dehydrogenase
LATKFNFIFFKVLRLKINQKGNIIYHSDLITGWLGNDGLAIGRPVDIEQSPEGDLYLSDDFLGVIYKISSLKTIKLCIIFYL